MKHHLFSLKNLSQLFLCLSMFSVFSGCIKATPAGVDTGGSTILSECSLNVATSSTCKLSTNGTIPTSTSGSNITAYTNATATTSITAVIPNGFYSAKSVTFTDAFLTPTNIKSGISIFGVTGTGAGFPSNAFRTTGTLQLSSAGEASTYAGIALPVATYRDVPRISTDDDGTTGGSVTYVNRTSWTGLSCGTSGTLEQRITHCSGVLGLPASWSGVTNGNSGQGNWKIVTRSGDCGTAVVPFQACSEVWRDESTQMLWSSKVSEQINWCRSSGSNNITGNPSAEVDPSPGTSCQLVANQAVAAPAVSACHDDGPVNFVNAHASITNTPGKGSLSKASIPAVAWRLPTKADYEQANANGMRFVLPDAGSRISGATSTYEWTASVLTASRANAWIFDSFLGYFAVNPRTATTYNATNVGVRCIGR